MYRIVFELIPPFPSIYVNIFSIHTMRMQLLHIINILNQFTVRIYIELLIQEHFRNARYWPTKLHKLGFEIDLVQCNRRYTYFAAICRV